MLPLEDSRLLKPTKSSVIASSPLQNKPLSTPRVHASSTPSSAYQAFRQQERDSYSTISKLSPPRPARKESEWSPADEKAAIRRAQITKLKTLTPAKPSIPLVAREDDMRETRRFQNQVSAGRIANTPRKTAFGAAGNLTVTKQAAKPNLDHYRVELRAWIPQSNVVDPMSTYNKVKDATFDPPSTPTGLVRGDIDINYSSHYRGDNHQGYGGDWRARSWIEFDYDGKKIANFKFTDSQSNHGVTHRDWNWDAYAKLKVGPFSVAEKKIASERGVEEARAGGNVSGRQVSSNSFSLGFSQSNPVQDSKIAGLAPSPAIDSRLDGSISSNGKNMTLKYDTDQFPSHGFQVMKNGRVVAMEVVKDASGVEVQGGLGAANIATRLSFQNNEGERQISIG
jgi:hypothetical protein